MLHSSLHHLPTVRKTLFGISCLLMGFILLWALGIVHVNTRSDMEPSLPKGSLTWVSAVDDYDIGDIVVFQNPLDRKQHLWARVLATEGDQIRYQNDGFVSNQRRLPKLDMREWDAQSRVWTETFYRENQEISWEIIQPNSNSGWQNSATTIPTDHLFVACDNREKCIDSRWWGPISKALLVGKVEVGLCLFCKDGMNQHRFMLYY